jgi:hypothetical protein
MIGGAMIYPRLPNTFCCALALMGLNYRGLGSSSSGSPARVARRADHDCVTQWHGMIEHSGPCKLPLLESPQSGTSLQRRDGAMLRMLTV